MALRDAFAGKLVVLVVIVDQPLMLVVRALCIGMFIVYLSRLGVSSLAISHKSSPLYERSHHLHPVLPPRPPRPPPLRPPLPPPLGLPPPLLEPFCARAVFSSKILYSPIDVSAKRK